MTKPEWMSIFGNNLYEILCEVGMTQKDLADELNTYESTISRYINGQRMPDVATIINLSYILDYDIGELIDFGDTIE